MLKRQVISCLGWLIAAVFLGLYRENRGLIKHLKSAEPQPATSCEENSSNEVWSRVLICFEELVKVNQSDESEGRIHTRYGVNRHWKKCINYELGTSVRVHPKHSHYYSKLKGELNEFNIDIRYFVDKDQAVRSVFGDSIKVNLHRTWVLLPKLNLDLMPFQFHQTWRLIPMDGLTWIGSQHRIATEKNVRLWRHCHTWLIPAFTVNR